MMNIIKNVSLRCFVVGGGYDYIRFLRDLGFSGAKNLDEADFLLFTGGEDVSPEFYNEARLPCTFSNIGRDRIEKVYFDEAVELGLPMVGICRGGQFLNVMSGGKMWQDINGHTQDHLITEVVAKGSKRKPLSIIATSTHHQMMRPGKDGKVLAIGDDGRGKPLCDVRLALGEVVEGRDSNKHPDIEVVWYENTKSLCFQPHPEYNSASKDLKNYFAALLEAYVLV